MATWDYTLCEEDRDVLPPKKSIPIKKCQIPFCAANVVQSGFSSKCAQEMDGQQLQPPKKVADVDQSTSSLTQFPFI